MRVAAFVVAALVSAPAIVMAQAGAAEPPAGRVDAAFGMGWLGGAGLGDRDADLRTRDGNAFPVFSTSSRFAGAMFFEARGGYRLTSRYAIEGRITFSHPELRSSISDDVEGAPDLEIAEQVDQYTFEGALVVRMPAWRIGSLEPFVSAGAGYLRQLHDGQTLVEEGVVYHGGGGVRQSLFVRSSGWLKAAAIRGDVRLNVLTGGIDFDDGPRLHPSAAASLEVTF